jgi:cullin 1
VYLLHIEASILKPVLQSLCYGKCKVINKNPVDNTINNTDTFSSNPNFHSNKRVIHIPVLSCLDSSHIAKRLEDDRSIAIEAAIIRIMKASITLHHQHLLAEVLSQRAFFKP